MNALPSPSVPSSRMTTIQWLICIIAAIGFMFDTYELLMMPLAGPPALEQLLHVSRTTPAGRETIAQWTAYITFASALCGGVFGLLGGYLTDLLGRRRVLTWSILLYACSSAASGFATSATMLLVLRCTTFIGVCVEFVAAVAWLSELFPEPKRREAVLGFTQAFASFGGLLVAVVNYSIEGAVHSLPSIQGEQVSWRYTLISGLIPALPLIFIRPFLPESPVWQEKKARGALKRPSIVTLFSPQLRRTTIVTAVLFACAFGVAFGALQITPQIVRGAFGPAKGPEMAKLVGQTASSVQMYQELGGLAGRFALAFLALWIVRRGALLRLFLVPGLLLIPVIYFVVAGRLDVKELDMLKWGLFVAGFFTVAQFSFWGNYLPRVYPTYLRGTGEGFAANVGGRMFGTAGQPLAIALSSLIPTMLPTLVSKEFPTRNLAYAAGAVALVLYAVALITSFWLPEPGTEELPE